MERSLSNNSRAQNTTLVIACGAALAALAATSGGCSFLLSEGAPDGHQNLAFFDCGSSWAPFITDSVVAGVLAVSAVGVTQQSPPPAGYRADAAIQGGAAALAAASAIYGFRAASGCREARAAREVALAQARALPPPYGIPPWGAPPSVWPPPLWAPGK